MLHTAITLIGNHIRAVHSILVAVPTVSYPVVKKTVSNNSSTIAELIAAFTVTKKLHGLGSLLAEIGYPQIEPTIIYEDNMSTIAMVKNDGNS